MVGLALGFILTEGVEVGFKLGASLNVGVGSIDVVGSVVGVWDGEGVGIVLGASVG